jgi:hypothetical protein
MAQKIIITRAFCEEHLQECLQSHNESTGTTSHVENYSQEKQRLGELGYVYTGNHGGQYVYTRRMSQPLALPLDWQMARETQEPEYIQDW